MLPVQCGDVWHGGACANGADPDVDAHVEPRAFARDPAALCPDGPAHQLREPPTDREAEPGPPVATARGSVRLAERFEQAVDLVGENADAGVGDRERDLRAAIAAVLAAHR